MSSSSGSSQQGQGSHIKVEGPNVPIKIEELDEPALTAPNIQPARGLQGSPTGWSLAIDRQKFLSVTPLPPAHITAYEIGELKTDPDPEAGLKCDYPGCRRTFKRRSDKTLHFKHEKWSINDLPYKCHQRGCEERFLLHYDIAYHLPGCEIRNPTTVLQGGPCPYGMAAFIPRKMWIVLATGRAENDVRPDKRDPTAHPQEPHLWILWRKVPLREAPCSGSSADRIRFMKDQWRDSFTPIPYETLNQYVGRQNDRVGLIGRSKEVLIQQYEQWADHPANVNLLPLEEADRRHPERNKGPYE